MKKNKDFHLEHLFHSAIVGEFSQTAIKMMGKEKEYKEYKDKRVEELINK